MLQYTNCCCCCCVCWHNNNNSSNNAHLAVLQSKYAPYLPHSPPLCCCSRFVADTAPFRLNHFNQLWLLLLPVIAPATLTWLLAALSSVCCVSALRIPKCLCIPPCIPVSLLCAVCCVLCALSSNFNQSQLLCEALFKALFSFDGFWDTSSPTYPLPLASLACFLT